MEGRREEYNHDTPSKKRKIINDSTEQNPINNIKVATLEDQRSDNNIPSHKLSENEDLVLPASQHLVEKEEDVESPGSSSASESDWQPPTNGAIQWIQSHIMDGSDPREILHEVIPSLPHIPPHVSDFDVWKLLIRIMSEPPRRVKLPHVNTFNDVIKLIQSATKIMVLTGAGVSVSCGIPDFRSRDGVYARLAVDFPALPNPEAMFDISYFRHDPRPFFKFAKEIYPGQYKPSLIHRFISLLEKNEKLLRNYTQNIDTLEQVAGISKVVQCHGSFATASCQVCKHQVDCEAIRDDIFNQVVPLCPLCSGEDRGILKPDIVFFGENLPDHFHRQMREDKDEVDLLIVIGSALKVRPVALVPNSLPKEVPQILINREPLSHMSFDVELLGDGDVIIAEICRRLGEDYHDLHDNQEELREIDQLPEDNTHSAMTSQDDNVEEKLNEAKLDKLEINKQSEKSVDDESTDEMKSNQHITSSDIEVIDHTYTDKPNVDNPGDSGAVASNVLVDNENFAVEDVVPGELNIPDVVETKNDDNSAMEDSENKRTGELRGLWKSRWKQSVSKRLPAGSYYYDGNHRYIFPGAEVAPEEESDCSSDESEDSSESSDEEEPIRVVGGLSPMQRHPFAHRLNHSLTPASMTSSDDDETAASLFHRTYRNNENKVGECSKQPDNDADVNCYSSAQT